MHGTLYFFAHVSMRPWNTHALPSTPTGLGLPTRLIGLGTAQQWGHGARPSVSDIITRIDHAGHCRPTQALAQAVSKH